ncbi:hypothetical protein QBC43DRAFT_6030 [Cladorrhinum sp. PSN259]|nr:hypothetical protein QBC43DRAFT_6030 [Cladorrhinum sp. PSN259]
MTEPSNRQGSSSHLNPNTIGINNQRVRFAEGKPEPDSTTLQPVPRVSRPSQPAAAPLPPPPGPAVYWDDRDVDRESVAYTANTAQLEQYTFYREPTPPPADYDVPEKHPGRGIAAGGPIVGSSSLGGAGSDRNIPHNETSNWSLADSREGPSKGKKRLFWIILAIGILMIIGVAVGVGVGVSMGRKSYANSTDAAASSGTTVSASGAGSSPTPTTVIPSTEQPTTATTPTGTHATSATSTSFSVASRPNMVNSDCPAVNNTIYQVPGSTQRFQRLCGVDYSGTGDAKDLAQVYTTSMIECIHACASFDRCTAAGWGYIAGDIGNEHRCFMKTDLTKSHAARDDWCFAILQK